MSNVCSLAFAILQILIFDKICMNRRLDIHNYFTSDNIYYVKSQNKKTEILHLVH